MGFNNWIMVNRQRVRRSDNPLIIPIPKGGECLYIDDINNKIRLLGESCLHFVYV